MRRRTPSGSSVTSMPSTRALPEVGRWIVAKILSAVVLPAPLAPSKPKTSPRRQTRSSPASACTGSRPGTA